VFHFFGTDFTDFTVFGLVLLVLVKYSGNWKKIIYAYRAELLFVFKA